MGAIRGRRLTCEKTPEAIFDAALPHRAELVAEGRWPDAERLARSLFDFARRSEVAA